MKSFLAVCAPLFICLIPLGCTEQSKIKRSNLQTENAIKFQNKHSGNNTKIQIKKTKVLQDAEAAGEVKIAGKKMVVQDVSDSYNFLYKHDDGQLNMSRNPESFPKTSPRLEIFDIKSLSKYRGPSYEKKLIKGGDIYSLSPATESNYKKVDILLSALKIPFVISVEVRRWSKNGDLRIIVEHHNYREAAKLLEAAIEDGFLVFLPYHSVVLTPEEIKELDNIESFDILLEREKLEREKKK